MDSFNIKQELFNGDLCYLDGYGRRIWEIIGLTKIKTELYGVETEDLTYYLECVFTGEEIVGLQEDSVLICRAKDAYQFIQEFNGHIPDSVFDEERNINNDSSYSLKDFIKTLEDIVWEGEENMDSNWDNGKARRLTAASIKRKRESEPSYEYPDTFDGLLDRLNDLNSQKDIQENVLKEPVDEDLLLEIALVLEELEEKRQKMN